MPMTPTLHFNLFLAHPRSTLLLERASPRKLLPLLRTQAALLGVRAQASARGGHAAEDVPGSLGGGHEAPPFRATDVPARRDERNRVPDQAAVG